MIILKTKRIAFLLLVLGFLCTSCRGRAESVTQTLPTILSPTVVHIEQTPTYRPYIAPEYPSPVESVREAYPYPGPSAEYIQISPIPVDTDSYPAPQDIDVTPTNPISTPTPSIVASSPYPGPGFPIIRTSTSPYPGPGTAIPTTDGLVQATSTPVSEYPATTTISGDISTTPSPTARISKPLGTPPPPPSTITIWHSWRDEQLTVLDFVIQSFQDQFPDVYFNLLYIPYDELFESYNQAAYNGMGPSILFGPAEWGPSLFDSDLVIDLIPYTSGEFLATINPVALDTCNYRDAIIGLPYAQYGILMIRNRSIISRSPESLDDLINLSALASDGSKIGTYIELGSFFSAAHLSGLGGKLMEADFFPSFNDHFGVSWMELVSALDRLGPVSFNSDNDVELFKIGQIGMIIDGSWNLNSIVDAVGENYVVVDPWPITADGKLSGYVQTDALYLNANITGDEQLAALRFMGFLLDKDVQSLLSEVGFIPSIIGAQPQSDLIQSAMLAFQGGTPFPVVPTNAYLRPYWDALNAAIQSVIELNISPMDALNIADDYVRRRLTDLQNGP